MKKINMTDILGLNWATLTGIILLLISVGLIIYGLNTNVNSKTLFNVSRLLALLSVAGVWYFGNINTKNTTLEIVQTKEEAAKANSKTKELEFDISNAKKETADARMKTEKIKLEVEEARTEREKLRNQALLLEKQNIELKAEANRIKSLRIFVNVAIELDGNFHEVVPSTVTDKKGGDLELFDLNGELYQTFSPVFGMMTSKQNEDGKLIYRVEYLPNDSNSLSIETLNSVDLIKLKIQELFDDSHRLVKFTIAKPIKVYFSVHINDIETLNFSITEKLIGDFLKKDEYLFSANSSFKNTFQKYKIKAGLY